MSDLFKLRRVGMKILGGGLLQTVQLVNGIQTRNLGP